MRFYTALVISILTSIVAHAQPSSNDRVYSTYDKLVSRENTDFYNGTEFTDEYLNTDGSFRYLKKFNYLKGSIVYMGQNYVDVLLRYDLLGDNLLTRSNDNLSIFNVKLIPEFISEFRLHNLHFVKLENFGRNDFFELAHRGKAINLYTKHKKKMRTRALKSGVQYSFKSINFYVLEHDGKFSQIASKRDLRRELPELKEQIDDFYRAYKSLYKQDRDEFMKKLIAHLDSFQKE